MDKKQTTEKELRLYRMNEFKKELEEKNGIQKKNKISEVL